MRIALVVLGVLAGGYGAYGLLSTDRTDLVGIVGFLVAVVVAHDFVIIPAAVGTGALIGRYAPVWARIPAVTALVVSAAVSVLGLPLAVGVGRIADNPSAFPRHYGRNLMFILCLVWTVAAVWSLRNRRRAR